MKFSEAWLREWVNPNADSAQLGHLLTMAGLEVEEIAPVAGEFNGIVVGRVLKTEKHPKADRLTLCEVDIGKPRPLNIVCGAANVRPNINVPVACIGAVLPNKTTITETKLRGALSQGMLCSAAELGLTEESEGLFILPQDALLGANVREYLQLNDVTFELSITPNRGDCLSIKGVAREVAALTETPLKKIDIATQKASIKDVLPIRLSADKACPRYVGRIIRHVKADSETPIWMKERLRRSGIRSIHPIVDVTNYVMLALGQPMHAFDLNTIQNEIVVRFANQGEALTLLDGSKQTLTKTTLVIADAKKPLAMAGVMGGLHSSVTLETTDILLESAYFAAETIAALRQQYHLNSDSAYRFERGVDYAIQRDAMELATTLILDIAGGEAGPIMEEVLQNGLPKPVVIKLERQTVIDVLGVDITQAEINTILDRLGFTVQAVKPNKAFASMIGGKTSASMIEVPSHRFDITLPEDLIEEIARVYGYDKIPPHQLNAALYADKPMVDEAADLRFLRQSLANLGLHEIVSYSFVDKKLQALLDPAITPKELMNPITADMVAMRTNLWPGLIQTMLYNKSRQQPRVRLFEIGTCFIPSANQLQQVPKLAGLLSGAAYEEQWGIPDRKVDFFDLKGVVENILSKIIPAKQLHFKPGTHPALHPGQVAAIYHQDQPVGFMGALHPSIGEALDIHYPVFIFELDLKALIGPPYAQFKEISKFPEIRRDIAILVHETVPVQRIQDTIRTSAGDWLIDVFIFDVYQGKGIPAGLKSIALALTLQHPSRTLVDSEVASLMDNVVTTLKDQLGAELRS
ncbi:MAG: phenylalanine--tRNA ligase subunit beta [Gammaproteobacteria bacterium RIFCSPHIGHO2_12_FULL_43_28]|nr:MAG: phenylalanine--tRNA ligase subunit beta [Gammaproteobacteria bacterium RIFCSPHIGHO2_12_FULL_43_28]